MKDKPIIMLSVDDKEILSLMCLYDPEMLQNRMNTLMEVAVQSNTIKEADIFVRSRDCAEYAFAMMN